MNFRATERAFERVVEIWTPIGP